MNALHSDKGILYEYTFVVESINLFITRGTGRVIIIAYVDKRNFIHI